MASNDVEVLDPATTVEKIAKFASERVLNRRHFMAALGVAGAAAGTGLVSTDAVAQQPLHNGYSQIDVLNFILNVKYLKATLYAYVTTGADLPGSSFVTVGTGGVFNAPTKITFTTPQITDMFNEMYYDDLNQLITLRGLLGTAAVGRQTINMLGTGTSTTASNPLTQSQAIALARMLEDLSVSTLAGAAIYLTGANLQYVAQALAVDGAHAAAVRLVSIQTGAPYLGTEFLTSFQVGTNTGSNIVYAILGTVTPSVGQAISAPGIPSGSIISVFAAKANAAPTAITTKSSATLTAVSSVTGLVVGQPITGTNIPALTVITAVGTNTITLSQAATASTTVSPTVIVTAGSNVLTGVSSVTGIVVGQIITGTNIPAGATIISSTSTTITISALATVSNVVTPTGITTAGSIFITAVSSVTGLIAGQVITGANIPSNTTIVVVGTNTITLSAAATGNSVTAESLSSPTTITSTTPTTEALVVGQNAITITQPANALTSSSAILVLSDSADVAPADPGTAALSAAGPAAVPTSSPAVYQGFFNTSGAATASANNPAGFAIVRNFQQVLAVLYNYNSSTTSVVTQNYEGGYYPVGVAGGINSVT